MCWKFLHMSGSRGGGLLLLIFFIGAYEPCTGHSCFLADCIKPGSRDFLFLFYAADSSRGDGKKPCQGRIGSGIDGTQHPLPGLLKGGSGHGKRGLKGKVKVVLW